MPYQVELDADQIAVALTETTDPLSGPRFVALETYDTGVLGQRWTGSDWVAVPAAEAPDPTLTKLEFRSRFTETEKVALYRAAETDVRIRIWLDDLNASQAIQLDDPRTLAGVQALEDAALIAPGRATEILTP